MMSEPPPAPNELIILMVCVGYSCAAADEATARQPAASAKVHFIIGFPPEWATIGPSFAGVNLSGHDAAIAPRILSC